MAGPNFGNTIFEGSLSPLTPVVQPVEDNSEIIAAQGRADAASQMSKGFDEIGRGLQTATSFFSDILKNQAEEQKNGVLSNLQQEILLIADAVDQNRMTPAEARSRLRVLNSQAVADNPALLDDINTLQAKLTSNAGLAQASVEGNEDYKRQQKLIDSAVADGYIRPGTSTEEGLNNYLNAKNAEENWKALDREFKTRAAMRDEFTAADKFKATNALKSFVGATYPWVVTQVEDARLQLEKGADPAVVLGNLKNNVGFELSKADYLKTVGGDIDVSYFTKGVERLLTNFEEFATGKITTDMHNAQVASIKAQHEATLMADPEIGALVAASGLIGNTSPGIVMMMNNRVLELFGKNGEFSLNDEGQIVFDKKPADLVGQSPDIKRYLASALDGMKQTDLKGDINPEVNKEIVGHIAGVLASTSAFASSTDDARQFTDIVNFFADPIVGKYAKKNGNLIPQQYKDKGIAVLQSQYQNVLLPLVQKAYEDAVIPFLEDRPGADPQDVEDAQSMFNIGREGSPKVNFLEASKVIEPIWNGTGVEFRPGPGYENNAQVLEKVKSLNTGNDSVAGPLNALIRATAHFNSDDNYKEVYDNNLAQRLWGNQSAETQAAQESVSGRDIDELAGGFQTEEEAVTDRDAYYDAIKRQESGGKADAKNPNSSATGLYQFLKGTWNTVVNSPEGKAAGLTVGGRTDPEQNEKAIRIFTEWNSSTLLRNGLKPTNGNLYAMHFLGNAIPVLTAPDNSSLADLLPPKVMNANPFLKGKDVAWFKKWVNKVGGKNTPLV